MNISHVIEYVITNRITDGRPSRNFPSSTLLIVHVIIVMFRSRPTHEKSTCGPPGSQTTMELRPTSLYGDQEIEEETGRTVKDGGSSP